MSDALQQQLEKARAARAQLAEHERLQALAGQVENLERLQAQEQQRAQVQQMLQEAVADAKGQIDAVQPQMAEWAARLEKVQAELASLTADAKTLQGAMGQAVSTIRRASNEAERMTNQYVDTARLWEQAGGTRSDLYMVPPLSKESQALHDLAKTVCPPGSPPWQGGRYWSTRMFFGR